MQAFIDNTMAMSRVEDFRREAEQARLVQQAKAEQKREQRERKASRWPVFFRPQVAQR
jgi:hypothetical protein